MGRMIPWVSMLEKIKPHYPKAGNGRQPIPLEIILIKKILPNGYQYDFLRRVFL
jgi:hypothetical protein